VKKVGIFKAKTHLSELCAQVEENQAPFLIERRGRPVAILAPVPPEYGQKSGDILSAWKKWDKANGSKEPKEEFPDIVKLRRNRSVNPVSD
jgi:antitoxin (DNA-binding transcriptional repressor) of toxin-antitoxin stability system